jgi:type 1 glutamine amidotransferase
MTNKITIFLIGNLLALHRYKIHSITILLFPILLFASGCRNRSEESKSSILILSGKNNHEWQKTTPLLVKIYKNAGLFDVHVTDKPDTLTYHSLRKYDVLISNCNLWPDTSLRMSPEWEDDLLKYLRSGGGMVFFHAGASSFYEWNEYHKIGIGRWGKDTNHGIPAKGKVFGFDQSHPITKGFKDFFIMDEIWEKTDIYPGISALASIAAADAKDGHQINEPAVFVTQTGKGRSFYTILGHDERALLNSGLQTLLLRAAQWCAGRTVTIPAPLEFIGKDKQAGNIFTWEETDTSVALRNHEDIIWKFNYNNRFGKPYFHPLSVNYSSLTCVSPPDHPWHLGLWFSWKYINEINYWEYLDEFKSEETGYKSAGVTEIKKIEITKNNDFSTGIIMDVSYHPANGSSVLSEKSRMYISAPSEDNSYFIDYDCTFESLVEEVVLDRTPVDGEPEGVSWGGYAGLSIRFNQDYTSPLILFPSQNQNYEKDPWLCMGFNTLTGQKAGICIMQNPDFTTPATSWYVINDPLIPFYYYSPAVLYDGNIILKNGESLQLKYRIYILPGIPAKDELQNKYEDYVIG